MWAFLVILFFMLAGISAKAQKTEVFDQLKIDSIVVRQASKGNFNVDVSYEISNSSNTDAIHHVKNMNGLVTSTTTLSDLFTVVNSSVSTVEQFTVSASTSIVP